MPDGGHTSIPGQKEPCETGSHPAFREPIVKLALDLRKYFPAVKLCLASESLPPRRSPHIYSKFHIFCFEVDHYASYDSGICLFSTSRRPSRRVEEVPSSSITLWCTQICSRHDSNVPHMCFSVDDH